MATKSLSPSDWLRFRIAKAIRSRGPQLLRLHRMMVVRFVVSRISARYPGLARRVAKLIDPSVAMVAWSDAMAATERATMIEKVVRRERDSTSVEAGGEASQ